MAISVIGFPLALTPIGLFPIWKTGHIASEPEVPYKVIYPAFLIDAHYVRGDERISRGSTQKRKHMHWCAAEALR